MESPAGANCWVEVDRANLESNVTEFKRLVGSDRSLMAVVKSNAYGHGMTDVASVALGAGADWLGVFAIGEGLALRRSGIEAPVLVLGPPSFDLLETALESGLSLTVQSLDAARRIARSSPPGATVHLKLETGTHRQGMSGDEAIEAVGILKKAGVEIEGAYTHFADIEDTTDHSFAELQLSRFKRQIERLADAGAQIRLPHASCSAATILFPDTYFKMARVGISMYGLWPSRETLVSANSLGRNALGLKPTLTWKTRISQVKTVEVGEFIGYGRTFKTTRTTRIAVLPVGYADGYDRRLSNAAHVLVRDMRAPVRGRVCMNLTMVDVTDIAGASAGDEAVLLGRQGEETISAEDLARHAGTINYEIVTRLAPGAPRILV